MKFVRPVRPRIVLDTNVLVSGVIVTHGPSALILDAVRDGHLHLVVSPALLDEFEEVISRPRITRKYPALLERLDPLLEFLYTMTILVPGVPSQPFVPDDPDDDWIVACALEGKANFIVSGDAHLHTLGKVHGVRVVTPRQFVHDILPP
ncbi:MAG: putative toxin-antitoxin system toxin component, PIN family [Anaerolineae bacterium]